MVEGRGGELEEAVGCMVEGGREVSAWWVGGEKGHTLADVLEGILYFLLNSALLILPSLQEGMHFSQLQGEELHLQEQTPNQDSGHYA
jgi:hypothetical protein